MEQQVSIQLSPLARATALSRFAKRLPIINQETADAAGIELNNLKVLRDDMRRILKNETDPLMLVVDAAKEKYSPAIRVVDGTMATLRQKIGEFALQQQRIAAAARAEADARIAAITAEANAKLAASQARFDREQESVAAEAASARPAAVEVPSEADLFAQPDHVNVVDEDAAMAPDNGPHIAESAPSAAQVAAQAEAVAIAQAADDAVARELACLPTAKVSGVRTTGRLDFKVIDMHALVKFVAANPEHLALLTTSTTAIRTVIKKMGLDTEIDGISVFDALTVITTGKPT
ncbi:MAG: hypothetical protein RLZZ373_3273 [Pseudomonadota bacterium]|jgi:hypothetical protein